MAMMGKNWGVGRGVTFVAADGGLVRKRLRTITLVSQETVSAQYMIRDVLQVITYC